MSVTLVLRNHRFFSLFLVLYYKNRCGVFFLLLNWGSSGVLNWGSSFLNWGSSFLFFLFSYAGNPVYLCTVIRSRWGEQCDGWFLFGLWILG